MIIPTEPCQRPLPTFPPCFLCLPTNAGASQCVMECAHPHKLWTTNCLFSAKHLLICWPHHTGIIIKLIFKNTLWSDFHTCPSWIEKRKQKTCTDIEDLNDTISELVLTGNYKTLSPRAAEHTFRYNETVTKKTLPRNIKQSWTH